MKPKIDFDACMRIKCHPRVPDCHRLCELKRETLQLDAKQQQTKGKRHKCGHGPHRIIVEVTNCPDEATTQPPDYFVKPGGGGVYVWQRTAHDDNVYVRGPLGPPACWASEQVWTDWPECGGKPRDR